MIFDLNLVGEKTLEETMTLLDVSEDRYYKALKYQKIMIFKFIFGDRQNLVASLTIILRQF